MDVTRRYVRNFSRWGKERTRAPENVLLYILDEIRASRRSNMSKQEKFKLEGEEMREYRELQGFVASAITAEICKMIPEDLYNTSVRQRRPPRPDPDAAKAEEARLESQRVQAERTPVRGPNGTRGAPNSHPDQQAPR